MEADQNGRDPGERQFDRLFEATYPDLYRYAVRRCPTFEDAEDLVAETFLVAWRRLSELPDGNAARLWLFGTARLLLMNQRRAAGRRRELARRLFAAAGRSRPHEPGHAMVAPEVLAALRSVAEPDREVLLLAAWEDLTPSEIASVLEISPAAARKRLQRARTRFRQAVADQQAPAFPILTSEEAGR